MAKKRNPHDALFRAADSAERAFHRRKASELRQNARTAQQQKDWPQSERLWRLSLEEDPGDRSSTIGLANALVYIGKLDEARRLTETLTADWPEDENGAILMARLAEERGDASSAIAQWRQALVLAPSKTQALIRLGRLLIGEGRFAEADECAARLGAVAPDNPSAGSLRAEIATAQGDIQGALLRRKETADRFPHLPQAWRDYGRALLEAGDFASCEALIARLKDVDRQGSLWLQGQFLAGSEPGSAHTSFWKEAHGAFPRNADFSRKYLHAALRDGRRDDALEAMNELFANPPLRMADVSFVVGLVNILEMSGEAGVIRRLVRDFLKGLRHTSAYRLAAIRLNRIIFEHFAKKDILSAPGPTERSLRMLHRAPAEPGAAHAIEEAAALQAELQASSARCLFDTDISRAQCGQFVGEIRARLSSATPYSFIRVGDGEANALGYEPELERFAQSDAAEREIVWWGRTLERPHRARLDARVLDAMAGADGLGIPTLDRVLRDVKLDRLESLARTRPGRGIRAAQRAFAQGGLLRAPRQMLTSAHIQHDLQKWNLYRELFAGLDGIVAVSCHPALPQAFGALFGTPIARHVLVPPRHASLAAFGLAQMGPKILPEVLDEAIAELGDELRGRLVIVGAGYAGKVIVHEAKLRGAVALDLGSIVDYWLGVATRSYQTASLRSPEPLRME